MLTLVTCPNVSLVIVSITSNVPAEPGLIAPVVSELILILGCPVRNVRSLENTNSAPVASTAVTAFPAPVVVTAPYLEANALAKLASEAVALVTSLVRAVLAEFAMAVSEA